MYINDSIRSGGPTRSSADFSVPRPRTHDDRTGRGFPDHLITLYDTASPPWQVFVRVFPPPAKAAI